MAETDHTNLSFSCQTEVGVEAKSHDASHVDTT